MNYSSGPGFLKIIRVLKPVNTNSKKYMLFLDNMGHWKKVYTDYCYKYIEAFFHNTQNLKH